MELLLSFLAFIVSFLTLFVSIFIPKRIMENQQYLSLLNTYMSFDYVKSYHAVINFFYNDCSCDVNKISEKYKERYIKDFAPGSPIEKDECLHFHRRQLNNFFYELYRCTNFNFSLRKRIKNDWTRNEAFVIKILIYMNNVVDSDPFMFMDISSLKYESMPQVKGISSVLKKMYSYLINQPRHLKNTF